MPEDITPDPPPVVGNDWTWAFVLDVSVDEDAITIHVQKPSEASATPHTGSGDLGKTQLASGDWEYSYTSLLDEDDWWEAYLELDDPVAGHAAREVRLFVAPLDTAATTN